MARRRRIARILSVGVLAAMPLFAASAVIAPLRAQSTVESTIQSTVSARLAALQDKLQDPALRFSVSATLAQLDGLEPDAAPGSAERGRLEFLRGFVLQKAERFDEAVQHDQSAVQIDAAHPFLTQSERLHVHYDMASMAEDAEEYDRAIDEYRRALALVDADPDVTPAQRFGMQEKLGFCLHEAEQYTEARSLNEATLAGEAKLAGADSPKLATVLNNLAQNQYQLKDLAGAQATLERLLAIATKAKDEPHMDSALFQLGVLAFETGRPDEARDRMTRRVQLAQAAHDPRRLAKAQGDLVILEDKLKEASR